MNTILIAASIGFSIVVFALGYLWLVRPRRNANYRAYQDLSQAAERNYRKTFARSGRNWR